MSLDNRIWTKGDTVGLAVSMAAGTGFLNSIFSLGANAVAGAMRQKEARECVPELLDQIRRGFTQLEVSMSETLETLYKKLGDSAKKILEETAREQMAETEQLFEETVRAAGIEEQHKEEIRGVLEEAKKILGDFEASLKI